MWAYPPLTKRQNDEKGDVDGSERDLTPRPPLHRNGEGEPRRYSGVEIVGLGEGGEVDEAGDAGDGADDLAGPVDDRIEVAVWGEARLDGAGERAEALGGEVGEGENQALTPRPPLPCAGEGEPEWQSGVGARRTTLTPALSQRERETAGVGCLEEGEDAAVVVGAEGFGDGRGVDVAGAEGGVRDGVEEAG
jgi:hypothetical protein